MGLLEQVLTNLQLVSESYPAVQTGYKIFKLPHDRFDGVTEKDYQIVDRLESLKTTLVTYTLIPKSLPRRRAPRCFIGVSVLRGSIGYYYIPGKKKTLAEVVQQYPHDALYSNFGFYMMRNLIGGPSARHPVLWAHNTRYAKQFHLPSTIYPFLGFSAFSLARTVPARLARLKSTFQGFERSLVGIHHDGQLEIILHLPISSYEVCFGKDIKLAVDIIDPPNYPNIPNRRTPHPTWCGANSPILYTPNLSTPAVENLRAKFEQSYWIDDSWQKFTPYVGEERTNLFIANKGNGQYPEDYAIALWEGRCPLPAFGAVLSFNKKHFAKLFGSVEAFARKFLDKKIKIAPHFPNLPNYPDIPNSFSKIYNG